MTEVAVAPAVQVVGNAVEISGEPTALYRFHDAAGRLLYVGISRNLVARWAQHETEKPWWPEVVRKTVVMYGSRREAEIAEGRAIRSESPLHNKAMGRRDASEPKRPARKLGVIPKKPASAPRSSRPVPGESYVLSPSLMTWVDDYARKHDCSRAEAVSNILCDGLLRFQEEELEALRATIAAEVAGNPEFEAEFAALTAMQAARRLESVAPGA